MLILRKLVSHAPAYVRRCVTIDTRTLALFRIAVGILILADLYARSQRFTFFYTEEGVVPRSLAMDMTVDRAFSFYFFTTDAWVTALLFGIQALLAVVLIIGYKTRVVMVLSFLFVISLDHRNPLVTSYADILFRFVLFWAMFLPLGERFSIDSIHARAPRRQVVANLASFAILAQMIYMYFANGVHKSTNELWRSGEATILIFGLDDITFMFGDTMRHLPQIFLQAGGLLWFTLLLSSPILMLLSGRLRTLFAALYFGGHAAFAFTVRIGAFAYVGMAGVLLFVQSHAWEDARAGLQRLGLYDRYAARAFDVVERGGHRLALWLPRLELPVGPAVRDFAGGVQQSAALIAIVMVLVLPALAILGIAGPLDSTARQNRDVTAMIGVRQPPWTVFAPNPRTTDRWFVFVARGENGELLDVYNDRPLSFERPHREMQKQYKTYRERFYMTSIRRMSGGGAATRTLADYLCERSPSQWGVQITHINMYAIAETVTRETVNNPEGRRTSTNLFYEHGCNGHEPERIPLPPNLGPAEPSG